MKWTGAALLAAVCLAPAASANFVCTLSATPALVSLSGLAEPVGDIALQCSGTPGQPVRLTLSVLLDQRIANPIDFASGASGGVTLWLDSAPVPAPLPVVPRLSGGLVFFENLNVNANALGALSFRISGLRAEAADTVTASIQLIADAPMFLPANRVVVARGVAGLFATAMPAAACCAGPALPETLDWSGVLARRPWTGAVRITEGHAGAFQPVDPLDPVRGSTRILVRLKGLPPGSRVFAPDGIAGDNAAQSTASGLFGHTPQYGVYSPAGGPSLLLSRVPQAARDGSGGTPMLWPGSPQILANVGEAAVEGDEAWVVYQVMESHTAAMESAEIPFWVFTPVSRVNETYIIRASAVLAPLSTEAGAVPGAPLPRYREAAPEPDCRIHGDCDADYFPRLQVVPSQTTEFTLASGGNVKDAYLFVQNLGGLFVEWTASVRYLVGDGWLLLRGTGGYAEGSYHYQLDPRNLPPGEYRAEIVFRQLNSPTGVNAEIVIPVRLTVTQGPPPQPPQPPSPPPAPPRPVIWGALTVPFDFWGPFAPGGLMRLQGQFFAEETVITVNGAAAQVLSVQPGLMLVVLPEAPAPAWAEVVAANGEQRSAPYMVEILRAAPSIYAILNAGGEANSEAAPAPAGSELTLEVTGIAYADEPLWVNIHDRWREARREAAPAPGLHRLRVTIPEDLPAMETAVMVCASAPGIDSICSHPRPLRISAAP
jgi:hypothetical protein